MSITNFLMNPLLLSSNVFTPLQRTPWAGELIYELYKKDLFINLDQTRIGESWEFSCSLEMPSYVLNVHKPLYELISLYPQQILGPVFNSCDILVKFINAAYPLSFQLHPSDDYHGLDVNECGKPESWLILHAKENCGIYLGFSQKIDKHILLNTLKTRDVNNIKKLFYFVSVKKGDYFDLAPGIPHAIGEGCVILEPQRVIFGKEGKTYRIWDWQRQYDAFGNITNTNGKERTLHIDEALDILDFERSYAHNLLSEVKKEPKIYSVENSRVYQYPQNSYYQVFLIQLQKDRVLFIKNVSAYIISIFIQGFALVSGKANNPIMAKKGQSLLLTNYGMPYIIKTTEYTELIVIIPANSILDWNIQIMFKG